MSKILIVDDEEIIRNLISLTLQSDNHETLEASDGESALDLIMNTNLDLIILDIMLPKITGLELLSKIQKLNVPVIFLTAKSSLQDKVLGLKLGAEDYITKPFEPLELLARVEVILRRNTEIITSNVDNNIKYKNITVYPLEKRVTIDAEDVHLTVKEYNLFMEFLANKDIVLTRENLINKIWGYDYLGESRTIDIHIKQLREKLALKNELQTVYKMGYKLKS